MPPRGLECAHEEWLVKELFEGLGVVGAGADDEVDVGLGLRLRERELRRREPKHFDAR